MFFALSSLSVVLASLALVSAVPHEQSHGLAKKAHHAVALHNNQKRFPGRATWYDVGLGACGNTNGPSDYIVALNSNQLDTSVYPPVQCGRKLLITYQGKSAVATVEDECPGCPFGALDMSKGLFTHFEPLGTGEFYMTWEWVSGGNSGGNDGGNDRQTTTHRTTTTTHRTTTTTKETTTTTTTTKSTTTTSSSSTSDSSSTTSSSSSSTTSSASPDADATDNTDSYIANQQQLIYNMGNIASAGMSS